MDNELSKQGLDLREDDGAGSVKIADGVVAMIAALASTEVNGVSSMNGNLTHELLNKIGYNNLTRGVKVEVFNKCVKIDLAIIIEYGFNIPTTSKKVQEKVKNAIESMTGLEVTDVNVRIAGVDIKK
ncbi:MAG: Asp23/Gls24 family envelope stress response protein [Lachnospiraceae bacterium]|nr:Asp23/Gls24 family envelope stress response protein [Lachnospiraceae bacterium]